MISLLHAYGHGAEGTFEARAWVADAEVAASYLVSHLASRSGVRLRQGARRPPLSSRPLGRHLDMLATTRLLRVSEPVARALVRWGEGERRVHLLRRIPAATELLAFQARGERCVSVLADGETTAPHADGLAFLEHDLCHLEKFVDPAHHVGQVGFFGAMHEATTRAPWGELLARFDAELASEIDHVAADMNGSAVFLFAALKMKLKMAVRRRIARGAGAPPKTSGPLDAAEQAAFDVELAGMLDLLGIHGAVRAAAVRVSTRRDAHDAAIAVLAHFEALGAARLAAR